MSNLPTSRIRPLRITDSYRSLHWNTAQLLSLLRDILIIAALPVFSGNWIHKVAQMYTRDKSKPVPHAQQDETQSDSIEGAGASVRGLGPYHLCPDGPENLEG